jgi:hypothetical protein
VSEESLNFKAAVLAADGGCIAESVESPCEGVLQAHHAITAQSLRKAGLREHLTDPRVGAAVCYRHHRRHHNRAEPLKRAMLPMRVEEFAAEHGLVWLLDRYYG